MLLHVLGSAAGGGFPQWNCGCSTCWAARGGRGAAAPRTTSSLALSAGDGRWFICNAATELGVQLSALPALWPPRGTRESPLHGVLLTDAELDHTLGLLALRHADVLDVYGTPTVRSLLERAGLLTLLRSYLDLRWHDVQPGVAFDLRSHDGVVAGLRCQAVPLGTGRLPRYAEPFPPDGSPPGGPAVVAYRVVDTRTGAVALLMPTLPRVPDGDVAGSADVLVVDGTFWSGDELSRVDRSAADLGHVPIGGEMGTLALLTAAVPQRADGAPRVVYTHLNNTNPVLVENSAERAQLTNSGAVVAYDGMAIHVDPINGE